MPVAVCACVHACMYACGGACVRTCAHVRLWWRCVRECMHVCWRAHACGGAVMVIEGEEALRRALPRKHDKGG